MGTEHFDLQSGVELRDVADHYALRYTGSISPSRHRCMTRVCRRAIACAVEWPTRDPHDSPLIRRAGPSLATARALAVSDRLNASRANTRRAIQTELRVRIFDDSITTTCGRKHYVLPLVLLAVVAAIGRQSFLRVRLPPQKRCRQRTQSWLKHSGSSQEPPAGL